MSLRIAEISDQTVAVKFRDETAPPVDARGASSVEGGHLCQGLFRILLARRCRKADDAAG